MIILKSENDIINFYYTSNNRNRVYYNERPFVEGYLFLENNDQMESIHKIKITKNSKDYHLTIEKFMLLLEKDEVIVIDDNHHLRSFLKGKSIDYNRQLFCNKCAQNCKIKFLMENDSYFYHDKSYCKQCTKDLLRNIIITNGFLDYTNRNNEFLLEKYHKIEDLMEIMNMGFNPVDNDKLTLYDTLAVTQGEYEKVSISSLNLPEKFKEILTDRIQRLLPVQILALREGLLENRNLLVVSQTGSGKTFIGELAGIPKAMHNEKMIYLSPLVALANQKYNDFKKLYEKLGLSITIKVGQNRIKSEDELYIPDKNIKDADIIVATYEGLDFILRSGNYRDLENLGCVVIDEIQMLENEERGHRLNALINRIMTIYPHCQLIGLSATIKNADSLSNDFSMNLVEYSKRPVMLERHFLSIKNKAEKNKYMSELCKKEFERISSKGYHGQTIIFTDSRRKTQLIASMLNKKGVSAEYYHAGLTYSRKLEIEEAFLNQEISAVVTTAALASGVDFPASMVIFDSIRMGREYLTNNEFHQMLGRAGRPSYHDIGRAYVMAVSKSHDEGSYADEDYDTAMELLKSDVNDISVLYDEMDVYEEVLSDICAVENVDVEKLRNFYDNMWIPVTFDEAIDLLEKENMIVYDMMNHTYHPTEYGQAISKSFINIKEARTIKNNIYNDITELILKIDVIHNAYLSNGLINKLSSILNAKIGSNVFSEKNKRIINEGQYINRLGQRYQNKIININQDLLNCNCSGDYCSCFEKNVSRHIINRRLQGWDPKIISKEFKREYEIQIYSGDIYSYLNQVVMILEAIKRISYSLNIDSTRKNCEIIINKIEEGK